MFPMTAPPPFIAMPMVMRFREFLSLITNILYHDMQILQKIGIYNVADSNFFYDGKKMQKNTKNVIQYRLT